MSDINRRVSNSYDVLGMVGHQTKNAFGDPVPVEGVHYETLAYTDFADEFQPTTVKWLCGAVDSFENRYTSNQYAVASRKHAS